MCAGIAHLALADPVGTYKASAAFPLGTSARCCRTITCRNIRKHLAASKSIAQEIHYGALVHLSHINAEVIPERGGTDQDAYPCEARAELTSLSPRGYSRPLELPTRHCSWLQDPVGVALSTLWMPQRWSTLSTRSPALIP